MPAQGNALLQNLLVFALFLGLMWFMLIRPQQQQQKRRREMLARLKAGDKVVTIGGIFGTLTKVEEDTVRLRIADKVEIRLSRDAVARVLGQDE
ncbi:preprotein translocase, YajC subunit [Thermaerobacter marianensis DSM 12885]|uniref:Preprotein translocase, YajC subunit n=1 Tax=Thermaerobacter marianensis (strain ATCC 700841 / DSM 12885 / JCM 10246 / 7p75a) TaxID=644966 RepID=E6SIX4_THEM7|nr:preprotein translocase subunit YajC [Thermaerobacter marianensis]ADU50969.1 preprotein translocase, YajC subunit [Thermaerobacter marianensis DSM 12885]